MQKAEDEEEEETKHEDEEEEDDDEYIYPVWKGCDTIRFGKFWSWDFLI